MSDVSPGGTLVKDPSRDKYEQFLRRAVSTGKLWAVWCGDTWATSTDPSGRSSALFLLWPSRRSAEASFRTNRGLFPQGAVVDSIELGKWLELYTPDLIGHGAHPFVHPDERLNGLIVDPADLRRDLQGLMFKDELQGTDLARLARKARQDG